MAISGLRHSDNFEASNTLKIRPQNWREGILLREPNGKAPLFALTALMKSKSVDDATFHWFEKIMEIRRVTLTADPSTTDPGTLTAASGAWLNAGIRTGHILRMEQTGELMRVTANASPTTVTVTRGLGVIGGGTGVAATAMNPATSGFNPNVHVVGNAMGENSSAPTSFGFDPTERLNHCQIFRDTLAISRTAQKTRLRTGDAVKEAKRETLLYHSQEIEWAMWMGQKAVTTDATGNPLRLMDGVYYQIRNATVGGVAGGNRADHAGATLNLTQLENYLERAFRYGSSEKMGFCGNEVILTMQRVARKNSSYQFVQGQKEYGMNVTRVTCPFGDIVLKTHPLFNQIPSGVNTTAYFSLSSWLFILDMSDLEYKYVVDSDTKYEPKLAANDLDGMLSGYLTECSIQLQAACDHFVIERIGAAAADS
jgi:hypothetical protein